MTPASAANGVAGCDVTELAGFCATSGPARQKVRDLRTARGDFLPHGRDRVVGGRAPGAYLAPLAMRSAADVV
jgi:hypothetical protein